MHITSSTSQSISNTLEQYCSMHTLCIIYIIHDSQYIMHDNYAHSATLVEEEVACYYYQLLQQQYYYSSQSSSMHSTVLRTRTTLLVACILRARTLVIYYSTRYELVHALLLAINTSQLLSCTLPKGMYSDLRVQELVVWILARLASNIIHRQVLVEH